MLTINIPEELSGRINEIAKRFCQKPEEYLIELIEERVAHDSAYRETAYLAESEINRNRLHKAINEIREGKYEAHGLIDEDD